MNTFQSSGELKASAREHMFGHYGTAIGAYLIVMFCITFPTLAAAMLTNPGTAAGTVIYYIISFGISVLTGVFVSGNCYLYLKISCGYPVTVSDVFYGFKLCPDKALKIQVWITAVSYIANIPLMIISYQMNHAAQNNILGTAAGLMLPYSLAMIFSYAVSIMLSLIYQQAFYLLHDFPQYSARELLSMSRRLMKGHKGRLFYIYVSFIPLVLLSVLSCGIALLWIAPYVSATQTEFFLDVIKHSDPHKIYAE
ncbi:MAG: DUF975 family protein [Lachnospiraceae bacterium]|nr:DUF975 family protein [Lachnospiraceae bacterium]